MECMIKQYRTCKPLMSIMCGEIIFYHTLVFFFFFFFFLWLENVVIPNYNYCKLLSFTQKNRRAFDLVIIIHKGEHIYFDVKTTESQNETYKKKNFIWIFDIQPYKFFTFFFFLLNFNVIQTKKKILHHGSLPHKQRG